MHDGTEPIRSVRLRYATGETMSEHTGRFDHVQLEPDGRHQPFEAVHVDDLEWETIRWPGEEGKMAFHPRAERPSEPNVGLFRLEPGAHHPKHKHDFAQVWYILEGEFDIGEGVYGPGSVIFHPGPHYEAELSTETGGLLLLVQYVGPMTREPPVYEERFDLESEDERKAIEEEPTDY